MKKQKKPDFGELFLNQRIKDDDNGRRVPARSSRV